MTQVCGHTGIPVGSDNCLLCRIHGCEGYKIAMKKEKYIKKENKATINNISYYHDSSDNIN